MVLPTVQNLVIRNIVIGDWWGLKLTA